MKFFKSFIVILIIVFASSAAWAGNLFPPGPPEEGSGMCTLDELYDYLHFGIYPAPPEGFREPDDYPGLTGKTLQEILDDTATEFMKCNAKPSHVLDTVKYFNTSPGAPSEDQVDQWGVQQGTMPTHTLSADSTTVEAGYYEATDLASVEPDLKAENIRSGMAIFGVIGAPAKELSPDSTAVEAGYYEATTLDAIDEDLTSSKIKGGVNIFGVQGSYWCSGCDSCCPACPTCTGTAAVGDVLAGKTFSSGGVIGLVGTMIHRNGDNASTARDYNAGSIRFTAPDGYYDSDDRVTATEAQVRTLDPDNDIVAENIRGGVNIFGMDGGLTVRNSVTGTDGQLAIPLPDGIYEGKTATAQDSQLASTNIRGGVNIFGTDGGLTVRNSVTGTDGQLTIPLPDGIYEGKKATAQDSQLASTNIRGGVNIFGTDGGLTLRNSVTGTDGQLTIPLLDGIYEGKTATAQDTNLTSGNIRSGSTIFGVAGKCDRLPATGQTDCWDRSGNQIPCANTGQDGEYQFGCEPSVNAYALYNRAYLPWDPSWGHCLVDNQNGTVTDVLTGLIWVKNVIVVEATNCKWQHALNTVYNLQHGQHGLTDNSSVGDWRLPNFNELRSLFDPNQIQPALPVGHPFGWDWRADKLWTSTTKEGEPHKAWIIWTKYGLTQELDKNDCPSLFLMAVRGP